MTTRKSFYSQSLIDIFIRTIKVIFVYFPYTDFTNRVFKTFQTTLKYVSAQVYLQICIKPCKNKYSFQSILCYIIVQTDEQNQYLCEELENFKLILITSQILYLHNIYTYIYALNGCKKHIFLYKIIVHHFCFSICFVITQNSTYRRC